MISPSVSPSAAPPIVSTTGNLNSSLPNSFVCNHSSSVEWMINYVGYKQLIFVPAASNLVDIELCGGRGGSSLMDPNISPGFGSRVQHHAFPVTAGVALSVFIGGNGDDFEGEYSRGGFNGGGRPGIYSGTGGGGASDSKFFTFIFYFTQFGFYFAVRIHGNSLENRVIVAGGGGGEGMWLFGCGGGNAGLFGQNAPPCMGSQSGSGGTSTRGGSSGDVGKDGLSGYGGDAHLYFGGGGGGGYYGKFFSSPTWI